MSVHPRALVLLAAVFAVVGPPVIRATTHVDAATNDSITLIRQDLALAADATLDVTVQLAEPLAQGDTIAVTTYQRIDTREELTLAIDDDPRHFADSIDLDPAAITTNADGTTTLHIPTESVNRTAAALQLPTAGLYPVVIDVQAKSRIVGELLTFVDRLSAPPGANADEGFQGTADQLGALNVAVVASITAPPAIPGSNAPLPTDAATALAQLAAYAEFTDLVQPTVSISPEILSADRVDPALSAQVQAVLASSLVLSQPQVPFDPSSAAAAGQGERFTQFLRDGENSISAFGESLTADREVWVSPTPITTEGASMLRDLGFRVLVISPSAYQAADGNKYGVTDFSQLIEVNLADETTMPTGVIDPELSDRLLDARFSPEQSALYVAADLVAWRDQLATQSAPVTHHTIAFGLSNGGVPDPGKVRRIAEMASGTGAAVFTEGLRDYEHTTPQLIDGVPINVTLNAEPAVDLTTRASDLDRLAFSATAVASMLVNDNGRSARWQQTTETLWSTSLTDADVATTGAALNAEFDAIKSSVVPPQGYSFSLSGRRATVPVRIANQSDEPLRVIVQLSAAADKLQFPEAPQVWLLTANDVTDIKVPVVARTNGSFDVRLDILTPALALPVTDTTDLRANVSTLTGLAQVLTGAGLLILLTWWVRNLRRNRRARRGTESMPNHPSSRSGADRQPEPGDVIEVVAEADQPSEPATALESRPGVVVEATPGRDGTARDGTARDSSEREGAASATLSDS